MAQWYVHTHSGQRFGPIEREELDRWVEDGRLTAGCQVWADGWPEWRQAPEIFPQLNEPQQANQASPGSVLGGNAPAGPPNQNAGTPGSPFAAGPQRTPVAGGYGGGGPMQPDRSVTIFVLGLLGILVCGILCIPAWIMGSSDMKEIDAGTRDPAGRGMTQAGMILGMIGCILMIIGLVIGCLWFVFAAAIVGV